MFYCITSTVEFRTVIKTDHNYNWNVQTTSEPQHNAIEMYDPDLWPL